MRRRVGQKTEIDGQTTTVGVLTLSRSSRQRFGHTSDGNRDGDAAVSLTYYWKPDNSCKNMLKNLNKIGSDFAQS